MNYHDYYAPYLETKDVRRSQHPTMPGVFIYNYTEQAQYSGLLKTDGVLRTIRGVIVDADGNSVARGFNKFFNHGERPDYDALYALSTPVRVMDKVDGSLGIPYTLDNGKTFHWATRGSFSSEQADEAHALAAESGLNYALDVFYRRFKGYTPLFEIVYPDNRIVLDYKGLRGLIYLGVVDNTTGVVELDSRACDFWSSWQPRSLIYTDKAVWDLASLKALDTQGSEGFVVVYNGGYMVKVKFDNYLKLHKVLTGLTDKDVLEHVKADSLGSLLELLPDEMHAEIQAKADNYKAAINAHMEAASRLYLSLSTKDRKGLAEAVKDSIYKTAVFAAADNNHAKFMKAIYSMVEI